MTIEIEITPLDPSADAPVTLTIETKWGVTQILAVGKRLAIEIIEQSPVGVTPDPGTSFFFLNTGEQFQLSGQELFQILNQSTE